MNHVLLMTATITPRPDTFLLAHSRPEDRLQDYMRALRFYLSAMKRGVFSKVIFAENSGSDLSSLIDLAADQGLSDRVEFLSLESGPSGQHSRFALELDLLGKAFRSPEISRLDDDTLIWKVTGRYIVTNIDRIVRSCPKADVYVNSRNYPTKWTDFYLAAFTKAAFMTLVDANAGLFDNLRSGEEILRSVLDSEQGDRFTIVPRMTCVPRIHGTRGFDQAKYGGARDTVKYFARTLANRVFPSLWI